MSAKHIMVCDRCRFEEEMPCCPGRPVATPWIAVAVRRPFKDTKGQYEFCSASCLAQFMEDEPEKINGRD